ncbi:MAG: cytochrome b/b6 domain-containing protein [Anaerolineales bacterium]|nr:cytochrome b/b6 domain-containing protein [Anaerolineales bacterium]NUQ85945.1 cytochrome b/b6 domain-containing protein [Anaerolineales bacterium]
MSGKTKTPPQAVRHERTFPRFTVAQRWEHAVLLLSGLVLLLTGLPQKYRDLAISQDLLSTPDRVELIRQIHHIAAIVLMLEALYHFGRIVYLMAKRRLPGDLLPTWQDVRDAWHMLQYLLFLRSDKPKFGRYNFEQKVTYWFIFFGILIMGISGLVIWFPIQFTRFLPGGVVPAAKLAHSTEAVVIAIFIIVWHVYHVHVERMNLSMFTGRLSEEEMRTFHEKEYERLTGGSVTKARPGAKK